MRHHKSKILTITLTVLLLAIAAAIFFFYPKQEDTTNIVEVPHEPTVAPTPTPENPEPIKAPSAPLPEPVPTKEKQEYTVYKMKTKNAQAELEKLVGTDNVRAILQTNRIDIDHITIGMELVIPKIFDLSERSPFPLKIEEASDITKLLIIDQPMQAFGVYESGNLVRWGPTSTGKKDTKTPTGLFSTNWKGEEVHSSFDDEWVLKYNFNINNQEGIGFHQYAMPGFPASHSCIRLLLDDAIWLYNWADQWILNSNEQKRLAYGTPVLVVGDYAFGETAPWKLLPKNPDATKISGEDLAKVILENKETIMERQEQREKLLAGESND